MKNRLQFRYHIPAVLPTRDEAMAYLKESFVIGPSNPGINNPELGTSLPAEPLVILYNDNTNVAEPQRLAASNVILAIGRGGDGTNILTNQDYFVIDFAKHDEEITKLNEEFKDVPELVQAVKETIDFLKADVLKNTEDINALTQLVGEKGDGCEKDTVYGYIQCTKATLDEEIDNREDADKEILHALELETMRATNEEARIEARLNAEVINPIERLNGDASVDGSVRDIIFDSVIGSIVTTVTVDDAAEQSLVKKFTIDGEPYIYTSNDTSDMKHNGNALNATIDELKTDVDNAVTIANEVQDKVNELNNKVVENTANVATLTTEVAVNKQNIESLKGEDTKINALISTLQATLVTLQTELANVRTELTNTKTELLTVKSELADVKSKAITSIVGVANEIKVTQKDNTATVGFADDAYFVAGA